MAVPPLDTPIVSPVLIGREQELDLLERALATAQRGTGQCLMIAGDAGVGKSRLLSEIRRRASAARFLTLQGSCFEQDSSFPYAPLIDALRAFFEQPASSETHALVGLLASETVKLVPELTGMLPEPQLTPPLDPEAEKRRLFESLNQFFISLARRQPLLIILEDLHWCDKISLDFLQLLARRLAAHPILILASYRQEDASPHLLHLLAQFDREHLAREIRLAPLTRIHVAAMLRTIFDRPALIDSEFLDLLYPLTEGNPFLIEEVLKALITAGSIYYTAGHWERSPIKELHVPRSVRDSVGRRTEQLSDVERMVLTLAAVAGRRFGFVLLQQAAEMHEQALLQVIKHLIAAQLVVEESADLFSFRHALTREAVYATLLRRERQALHRRIAQTLERINAEALDPHTADLAYHYYAAQEWAPALHYARHAGERAQALYAPHAAIEHFTRALEAAQRLALAPPLELLRARGRAHETAGHFEAARRDYEHGLRAAQAAHDAAAEWQALIDLGFLWTSRDYARTGEHFRRALELARTLGEPATIGHSLNRLGNWYANVEQPGESLRYHQEALALFQQLNDQRGLVETLDLLAMANQLNSHLIQSHVAYRQAIILWRDLDDRRGLVSSLASLPLCAASYYHDLDIPAIGLAEAAGMGEQAVRIARAIGWRAGEAYALLNLGMCLGPLGAYERALEAARTCLATAEEIEHGQWIVAAHTLLGRLYLDLLAFDAARAHLERALALADRVGSRIWTGVTAGLLASLCVAQGEFGRAEALLETVLPWDAPMQTQIQRSCWYARAELALARGQAESARQIAEKLIASAPNRSAATIIPRLWQLHGEALFALGETHQAESLLREARQAALAHELPALLWLIYATFARLYAAQARRHEAEAQGAAAREMIQDLAASVPVGHLRDSFVERALRTLPNLPAPSPGRAAKEQFGGLTSREREVAALVAQGKSNREIAQALVVGVRTVEAHITRILSKLDFASRAQIAVWTVEQGLARAAPPDKW